MRHSLLFLTMLFVTVVAVAAENDAQSSVPKPPKTAENRISVSGAVNYAYTRKTASCGLRNGRLVSFAAPDTDLEPSFPVTAGILENGAWHMQIHPPEADRDFEDENAGGVVLEPLPGGNWRIELHNIKMPERVTMSTNYAYVSGTITCTSYVDLSHIGR